MSNRQMLLRRKLAANERRLKLTDRRAKFAELGLSVSSLGVEQHEGVVSAIRRSSEASPWRQATRSDLAIEIAEFGEGDTLFIFDWSLNEEPGFVARRNKVAELVEAEPANLGADGFVAVDSAISGALLVDIDEEGTLALRQVRMAHQD